MREEFEQWAKSRSGDAMKRDGDYVSAMTREWWKAWQASRQSLVVKLPELCDGENSCKCYYESQSIEDALDAAGVRYE